MLCSVHWSPSASKATLKTSIQTQAQASGRVQDPEQSHAVPSAWYQEQQDHHSQAGFITSAGDYIWNYLWLVNLWCISILLSDSQRKGGRHKGMVNIRCMNLSTSSYGGTNCCFLISAGNTQDSSLICILPPVGGIFCAKSGKNVDLGSQACTPVYAFRQSLFFSLSLSFPASLIPLLFPHPLSV